MNNFSISKRTIPIKERRMEQQKAKGKATEKNWRGEGRMKWRWRRRVMEGEERGSESHCDLFGFRKKGGGGGMETGNQL